MLTAVPNVLQEAGGPATQMLSARRVHCESQLLKSKLLDPECADGGAARAALRLLPRRYSLLPINIYRDCCENDKS